MALFGCERSFVDENERMGLITDRGLLSVQVEISLIVF